jgi:PAS domain S-box-containing protein
MTFTGGRDLHSVVLAAEPVRSHPQRIPGSSYEKPVLPWGRAFYPVQVALLAAVYFGAAKLGLTMAFVAEQVTAVWPPTGIALAALLLLGYRAWPGIALGAFLVNATTNAPVATAAGIALGNTLEALVGAWLLRRLVRFDPALGRVKDVLSLVVLAAGVSTLVSATIGATSLCLGGVKPWMAYPTVWSVWWLGDAMGDLVVAPLLLTWAGWHRWAWQPWRVAEAGALLLALVAVSLLVFAGPTALFSFHPLAYAVFPFVIWAALRFGQPAATLMTFVASGLAIWGTVRGHGPFAAATTHESLILVQLFMGVVAGTTLVLGAVTIERKRAEERFRLVVESAPCGMLMINRAGHIVLVNALTEKLFGHSRDELLGQPVELLVPDRFRPKHAASCADFLANPTTRVMGVWREVCGRHRDGGELPLEVRLTPIEMAEGLFVLSAIVDITERKRAEEVRSRLAAIVESSEDAILSKTLDGIILTWNRGAERMYGYSAAEVVGRHFSLLVPPEHAGEVAAILEQLRRGERLENHETVRLRKDGTRIEVALNISPMTDAAGRITGASAIGRDITTRKRSERRLAAVYAVTCALARSASLEEAAAPVLQTVCETLRCDLGVLWQVDAASDVLRCAEVWHVPGIEATEFERFSRRITFARHEGLPGRAWGTGNPAWVAEAPFPRSVAARRKEPSGALAFPLRSDANTLGVLELFSPDLRQPDSELFLMVTDLCSQIAQFIERRQAERVVHARAREFSLARTIQQGLLPKALPDLPGFEIAGASYPTQETGGDYFDFFPLSDGHWGIAVGDACGHGIGAALLIAETHAYLRALALSRTAPGQVLDSVNQRLVEDIPADHFVTLFFARLSPLTRSLVYGSAGHLPGYVLNGRGEVKVVLQTTGLPLGVDRARDCPTGAAVHLDPGDLVFLLSDGIVEARSSAGLLFGIERTLEVVQARRHEPPADILAALVHEVRAWSEGALRDDITAVILKSGG